MLRQWHEDLTELPNRCIAIEFIAEFFTLLPDLLPKTTQFGLGRIEANNIKIRELADEQESRERRQPRARAPSRRPRDRNQPGARAHVPGTRKRM